MALGGADALGVDRQQRCGGEERDESGKVGEERLHLLVPAAEVGVGRGVRKRFMKLGHPDAIVRLVGGSIGQTGKAADTGIWNRAEVTADEDTRLRAV